MILLLGEAPNYATIGAPEMWLRPDLSGIPHAANRLRDEAGWSTSQFLRVFAARDNVMDDVPYPWRAEHTRRSIDRARAAVLREGEAHGEEMRAVVVLGSRARHAIEVAFGGRLSNPLDWFGMQVEALGRTIAIAHVPHPSGRNRWWNTPGNARRAREFLGTCEAVASGRLLWAVPRRF